MTFTADRLTLDPDVRRYQDQPPLPPDPTRVGGVPDVVTEDVDGFLVEPGDFEALAERLSAWPGPGAAARDGRGGTRRVVPHYAIYHLIDDIDQLHYAARGAGAA